LPYIWAVSMWRYPASKAVRTAIAVSEREIWNTPNPNMGIEAPLFNWVCGIDAMVLAYPCAVPAKPCPPALRADLRRSHQRMPSTAAPTAMSGAGSGERRVARTG
jgi:hypothetical protein